jgi:hypothetical protein
MRALRVMVVMVGAVLASVAFFRVPVMTGFDALPCDGLDGSLIFGFVNHWKLVFSGLRDWLDLGIFWPEGNTLGYSDTFFLHGVVYSLFCKVGMDCYYAFTATFMAMAVAGFALMHLLLRRSCGLPFGLSLIVSFAFVNLSPVQAAGTHLQLTTVWLLPGLLLMGIEALRGGRWAWAWVLAFAVSLAVLFFTAFYVPWFFVFFLCVAGCVRVVLIRASCGSWRDVAAAVRSWLVGRRGTVVLFFLVFAASLAPFCVAYLPALSSGGAWSYKGMFHALPLLVDFVNVGGANSVWGRLFGDWAAQRAFSGELSFGLPLATFLVFLGAVGWLAWSGVKKRPFSPAMNASLAAGLSVMVCWFLLLRVSVYSPWWLVHTFVPGAGAIRAAFRFNVVLSFFALVTVAFLLRRLWDRPGLLAKAAVCALTVAVASEQFSRGDAGSLLRRSEDVRLMQSVPEPPAGTGVFVVRSSNPSNVWVQVTAFRIAQHLGLKTVNGFSGSAPRGFFPVDVRSPDYVRNVAGWLDFSRESLPCLDLDSMEWGQMSLGAHGSYAVGTDVVKGGGFPDVNAGGWSGSEPEGVWSEGKFAKIILFMDGVPSPKQLELECSAFVPEDTPYQKAVIRVNGHLLGEVKFLKAGVVRRALFLLPPECDNCRKLVFTFDIPKARSPSSRGLWNDDRRLGILLKSFVVAPSSQSR